MKASTVSSAFMLPKYWNLMSDADKYQYNRIRAAMSSPNNKNQRNKRIETFSESLEIIKKFAVRGDADDWRRCLTCGVCWLPEGLAINTHQLKLMIFKCKSSINGSLQKMGFNVSLGRTEAATAMVSGIPFLKENSAELRQWTVRRQEDGGYKCSPPAPISPPPVVSARPVLVMPEVNLQLPEVFVNKEERNIVTYPEHTPLEFDLVNQGQVWGDACAFGFDDFSWE